MIQMMLNVVMIFLVQLMMEEKEVVYFLINVMVKKLVENVQEVIISYVVLEKIHHLTGHAMEEEVLALMWIIPVAIPKLLLAYVQVQIMSNVVLQEVHLHGILIKESTLKLFVQYLGLIQKKNP